MRDITLDTFINTIFDLPLSDPASRVCLTLRSGDDWSSYPATPRRMQRYAAGDASWYFCVSSVAAPREDGYFPRGRNDLRHAHCLVLDDIGTKAAVPPVAPSWALESSKGNFQYGYLLDPIDLRDPGAMAHYEGCVAALGEAGYGDKGAGGSYRVMRVPGSLHKTGFVGGITDWSPERFWALDDLMAELDVTPIKMRERKLSASGGAPVAVEDLNDPVLDWLVAEGHTTGNEDGKFVEVICPWAAEHTGGDSVAGYTPAGYDRKEFDGAFSCLHEHCAGRGKKEFSGWVCEQQSAAEIAAEPAVATTDLQDILISGKTEDAVAAYAALALAGRYLFAVGGGWMKWCGTRWQPDAAGSVHHEIRKFARWHNKDDGKTMAKASFIGGVVRMMERDPAFTVPLGDFDADEFLLATPDGTLDLKTGLLQPANPADLISKITRVGVGGDAYRFKSFLLEVMDRDVDSVNFLQRALGAMLSGAVNEHWIMFWIGQGRNGKNTLGDLVQWILGDYATVMQSEALMSKKHADHPTEIMTLRGRRMVTSSEITEGAYWNESRLNQVTGDAMLTGRFMRGDFVEFKRTHKHLVYGNHRPRLRNVSPALRARVKVVPFPVSFLGREDAGLGDALRGEAGGVLAWLAEGHVLWLEGDMRIGTCPAVDAATRDYFESQSTIEGFIDEHCIPRPGAFTPTASLYHEYRSWKEENGEHPVSKNQFSEQMATHFEKHRTTATRGFIGVVLKSATGKERVATLIKKPAERDEKDE